VLVVPAVVFDFSGLSGIISLREVRRGGPLVSSGHSWHCKVVAPIAARHGTCSNTS